MFKIGLTGGIGSGKSSVAKWFVSRGLAVIDVDKEVHKILDKNEIITLITREFGNKYIENRKINRRLLGGLVFNNKQARKTLEEIIHPLVLNRMIAICQDLEAKGEEIVIIDIPLLYEAGWDVYVDEVWLVYVPLEIQIERIMKRNNFSRKEAEVRIRAQIPLEDKVKKADIVIDNSRSWKCTEDQLEKILEQLNIRIKTKKDL